MYNHSNVPDIIQDTFHEFMREALTEASYAVRHGDIPVGAVIADHDGAIVGRGHNQNEYRCDPTLHAEMVSLRKASQFLNATHLDDCTLVTTLEPCPMCAGAIVNARIRRLVFAAWDPKAGAAGSVLDITRTRALPHRIEVIGGVMEKESAALLKGFFKEKRHKNNNPIC